MLRKIRLYGQLAKFVGKRVLEADIATAGEGVRFLVANWPELESHMANQYYRVDIGGHDLALEEVHFPIGKDDIKIVPVIGGAGGNTTRILIGAALITAAILTPTVGLGLGNAAGFGAGAAKGAVAGTAASWGSTMIALGGNIGIALVLSGVAGLLTPVPKVPTDSEDDPQNSFSFSGIQQTSRAGVAVPVCYGEVYTGSVVISAEIDVEQVQA